MYNDQSPNEALSLSIAFKILQTPACNLFVNMSRDDYFCLRKCANTLCAWSCCLWQFDCIVSALLLHFVGILL